MALFELVHNAKQVYDRLAQKGKEKILTCSTFCLTYLGLIRVNNIKRINQVTFSSKMPRVVKLIVFACLLTFVVCENCTDIVEQLSAPAYLFARVNWKIMPEKSAACLNAECSYVQNFACLNPSTYQPLGCSSAKAQNIFPYCAGRAIVDAQCSTWECCENLNQEVFTYLNAQWSGLEVLFNYKLLLYSNSQIINCPSYSPGIGPCLQWLEYAASSDWNTCMSLEKNFKSADAMAFQLF